MIRVRFQAEAGNSSLRHRVQTGSETHSASYPMGTGGSFRPGREADHSPPSSAKVKECMELYLPSPNTSSWLGSHSQHRNNFTFYLYQIIQTVRLLIVIQNLPSSSPVLAGFCSAIDSVSLFEAKKFRGAKCSAYRVSKIFAWANAQSRAGV
jgi:hypothetical protein